MTGVAGFSHTGVQVADLDCSIAFYVRLGLALAARWENGAEYVGREVGYPGVTLQVAVLTVHGSDAVLELLQYEGVESEPIDPATGNPGTGHFCLLVEDLDGLYAELADEVEFISEPQTPTIGPNKGGRVVYLKDPDGFRVELLQTPRTMTGELR
jgi:catechol 2,3-dioxygenase-like lactoylglutathione lyase family enzyme